MREKDSIINSFHDIDRHLKETGELLDRDLYPETLDRSWNQLMIFHEEKHQLIIDEISRQDNLAILFLFSQYKEFVNSFRHEKLYHVSEKILNESRVTDSKLDEIEAWIEDEAKRVDHLHPKDAKNNCDQV